MVIPRFVGLCAALVFGLASGVAIAQVASSELEVILHDTGSDDVARMRSSCAMGLTPSHLAEIGAAGRRNLPSVGAWCVTVLTRTGRDGQLGYVRDSRSDQLTPALAFDSGFVKGYLAGEALPAGTPTMATLLPVADRCLAQSEPNTQLCSSVGVVLGARAAHGELVPTPAE